MAPIHRNSRAVVQRPQNTAKVLNPCAGIVDGQADKRMQCALVIARVVNIDAVAVLLELPELRDQPAPATFAGSDTQTTIFAPIPSPRHGRSGIAKLSDRDGRLPQGNRRRFPGQVALLLAVWTDKVVAR